jgi:hypothetical protein
LTRKNDPQNWRALYPNRSDKANYLKAVKFQGPEWIPCSMSIYGAVWQKYRERLTAVVERYPFIFGNRLLSKKFNYDRLISNWHKVGLHSDNWGCVWQVVH